MNSPAHRDTLSLVDLLDRILDKGLVINADIAVAVAGVELLGIKIRATLASFETAARYGLEFPSGTRLDTPAWKAIMAEADLIPSNNGHRQEELPAIEAR